MVASGAILAAMNDENDVQFEPEEDLGDLAGATAKIKKLRAELEKVKEERQQYLDGWQRCKADSVNARKDALIAADRASKRDVESLAEAIIHALDAFDMAAASESWGSVDERWRSGMEHIRNTILDALKARGITRFGKVGEMFDPALHEAVQEADGPGESHSILRVLRYGYRTEERVLRAAQVVIKQ